MRFILPILMTLTLGCGHNKPDTGADTNVMSDEPHLPPVVCTGDYSVLTEPDLEVLEGCTIIEGSLEIVGGFWMESPLTNVDVLSSLTTVEGDLYIEEAYALTDLDGLSSLTSVGGVVWISRNKSLTNVDGLSSLTSVDGGLGISSNWALTNVDGLSSLTYVGHLALSLNDDLADIDGLSSLTSVGGTLSLTANDFTDIDGLSSLTYVGGHVSLYSTGLVDIDGLLSLTFVGDGMTFSMNHFLCQSRINTLSTAIGGVVAGSISSSGNADC